MSHAAFVTGGGSGVGRATALELAWRGWRVAVVGRRASALSDTAALAQDAPGAIIPYACDITDPHAVQDATARALEAFTRIDALVNAAGVNTPRRRFEELSLDDYRALVDTNLHGAYYCAQAFLPHFRAQGGGTIVNVVSEAGRQASAKAGPGYVASKFALAGLTQSLNTEERRHGVRAVAIFPGDIDTPMLDQRPQVPDAAARAHMLKSEDVAACVVFCLTLPAHVVVEEMLVRPR